VPPGPLILVVDDDADLRDSLAQVLLDEGYAVAKAAHGGEALDCLRAGPLPSVILLDLMMPVLNGWQFREAQVRDPELASIPVLVISADPSAARAAAELGVTGSLSKPLDVGRLLAAIERCAGPAGVAPRGGA
jgi:CheY-like chemotaxis protein